MRPAGESSRWSLGREENLSKSNFTDAEIEYLRSLTLARIATVGPDGQPHIIPVTFHYNGEEDTIDVGGINFAAGKKWRDAQRNPRVTFLLDDSQGPGKARAIEVRGEAKLHTRGGEKINLRFSNFAPEFFRIHPKRIVSWGLEPDRGWQPHARDVR